MIQCNIQFYYLPITTLIFLYSICMKINDAYWYSMGQYFGKINNKLYLIKLNLLNNYGPDHYYFKICAYINHILIPQIESELTEYVINEYRDEIYLPTLDTIMIKDIFHTLNRHSTNDTTVLTPITYSNSLPIEYKLEFQSIVEFVSSYIYNINMDLFNGKNKTIKKTMVVLDKLQIIINNNKIYR